MRITREDVLEAIESEPLCPGDWQTEKNGGCFYCAIGATISNKGVVGGIDLAAACIEVVDYRLVSQSGNLAKEILEKNYLGAISIQFERICGSCEGLRDDLGNHSQEIMDTKVKPVLKAWILKNIPNGVLFCNEGDE